MNIDLGYLKYFYYVVTEGGFTRAAEKLHVQQPVVSRAIKLLEEDLGTHLLERQKKRVILTPYGVFVYEQCLIIFNSISKIEDQLKNSIRPQSLIVATSDSLSNLIIDTLFTVFKKENPSFKLNHHSGPAVNFLEQILCGEIDLGIFFNVPKLPRGLIKTEIAEVNFSYVIKQNLKDKKEFLNSYIASKTHGIAAAEDLPLFKKYLTFNKSAHISLISSSSQARKSSMLKGHGVTILPDFMIKDEIQKGTLVTLGKPEKLTLYLIERESSFRNQIKNRLVAELLKIIE